MKTSVKVTLVVMLTSTMFLMMGTLMFLMIRNTLKLTNLPSSSTYVDRKYTSEIVEKVCDIFDVSDEDIFCANPTLQNADTLESMLDRNYPVDETKYDDFIPLINNIPSQPSSSCEQAEIDKRFDIYRKMNCPRPEQCGRSYTCTFNLEELFSDVLFVNISYPNGEITGYAITRSYFLDENSED